MDLQLEELRNRVGEAYAQGTDPISRIQESMRSEIAALRDFTQQLRSVLIDSSRLLGYLAGLAAKFQVERGIVTRFVSDVEEVDLPPEICGEVARIAQEALVNVRKHSNASEALIRFGRRNGGWVLGVIDNGRGFGFSGRLSHRELQSSGKGPTVIMERARAINGEVSIESYESGGCCLEVVF
jgi:signal transduction histidine kinase